MGLEATKPDAEEMLPSRYYTPFNFFGCDDAPYYVESLKTRFGEYFGK